MFESNNFCVAAAEDLDGGGIVVDGTGDEDQDGLEDFDKACRIGTDPCNPDTDGDSCSDADEVNGVSFAGGTSDPSDPLMADADGDGDGLVGACDPCPGDASNTCPLATGL